MNQSEIDELLESSEEDGRKRNESANNEEKGDGNQADQFENEEHQQHNSYDEEFDEPIQDDNQGNEDNHEKQEVDEQQPEQNSKIQSEYASEAIDEIVDEEGETNGNNKKQDDLSLVQSEFIESGKLNDSKVTANKLKNAKARINTIGESGSSKPNGKKQNRVAKKQVQKKQVIPKKKGNKQATPTATQQVIKKQATIRAVPKKQFTQQINKKESSKLNESEIAQKMKAIQQQKKRMEQAKKEREVKDREKKQQQYEEAKMKQNEKKQRNKAILQEQKKKKLNAKSNENQAAKEKNIDFQAQQAIKQQQSNKGNFKYMEMNAQRSKQEKEIRKNIEEANKRKLKELAAVKQVKKIKGEEKKQQFLKEKDVLDKAQVQEKRKEEKQVDVLMVKQLKQQIKDIKYESNKKKIKIFEFDKTIADLKSKLKLKEKQLYLGSSGKERNSKQQNSENMVSNANFSDLSPIEKFVTYFPEAHQPEDIFNILDENKDGMLTLAEIGARINAMGVDSGIVSEVHRVLDENSDGNVTIEEFSFIIDTEIRRQKDYRQIMGEVQLFDPIQIEARIIDMKGKIDFMNKKIEGSAEDKSAYYEQKYEKYLKQIKKIEEKQHEKKDGTGKNSMNQLELNSQYLLAQQAQKLSVERQMQAKLMKSIQENVEKNLRNKNSTLLLRVQESLRLEQKIYDIQNEIQETQLRFLSLKKIQDNKQGYLLRQTKQRNEVENLYRKAQQYRIKVSDPTKQLKNKTYQNDIKFLAAVILIQRNYRKKKALKQVEELKKQGK